MEVPLLRSRETGEIYGRPANAEDNTKAVEANNEAPIQVHSTLKSNLRLQRYAAVEKEVLPHLLDD